MSTIVYLRELFDKLPSDWLRLLLILVVLFAFIWVLRMVSRVNRALMVVILLISGSALIFSWIRNRTEPAFLTPAVDAIAPYFPVEERKEKELKG